MELIERDNRRLKCHHCGAVFEDKEAEIEGPPYTEVVCPYCGYGWFSNTEEGFHPSVSVNCTQFKDRPKEGDPESEKYLYWWNWLEGIGIEDSHVLEYRARVTTKRELEGANINKALLARQAYHDQQRRQRRLADLVPDDSGAGVAAVYADDTGLHRETLEDSTPSPEDYLVVDEVRKIADEVWEKLNNTGRPKKYGVGWGWQEAIDLEYPGDNAPAKAKQEYKKIKGQVAVFRKRLQEALDEQP